MGLWNHLDNSSPSLSLWIKKYYTMKSMNQMDQIGHVHSSPLTFPKPFMFILIYNFIHSTQDIFQMNACIRACVVSVDGPRIHTGGRFCLIHTAPRIGSESTTNQIKIEQLINMNKEIHIQLTTTIKPWSRNRLQPGNKIWQVWSALYCPSSASSPHSTWYLYLFFRFETCTWKWQMDCVLHK